MCILVLFRDCIPGYPLLLGANRDEYYDRPATPPALWSGPERGSAFLAPRDVRAGGTWIGLNQQRSIAAVTNRKSVPTKKNAPSRGTLCAEVLSAGKAEGMARQALETAGSGVFNGFNLLVADLNAAYLLSGGGQEVRCQALGPGVHVLTNEHDLGEVTVPRIEGMDALLPLLKSHEPLEPRRFSPCKHFKDRGTRSSTLIALGPKEAKFLYADGPPCETPFEDLSDRARELWSKR